MEKAMLYTDDTPLLWGEYKFIRLSRIPAQYLLSLHKNGKTHDKALLRYVDENKENLKLRLVGDTPTPAPSIPCEKRIYLTDIEAKKEIKRILKLKQNRKKPIRTYECETCNGWHLTSLPLKVWLRRKQRN